MRTFLFVLGATNLLGCSAVFHGVAPASDHQVYVVGSENDEAAAWLCPEHAHAPLGCRKVHVTEWVRR